MIKNLLFAFALVFGFSTTTLAGHHEKDHGMKKTEEKKETKTNTEQKAEADAALKKVEAMTKQARGDEKKEDEKKTK